MIGAELGESESELPDVLANVEADLSDRVRNSKAWKSFAAAIVSANEDLDQNDEKFDAGDPNWQIINVGEARDKGIMPNLV